MALTTRPDAMQKCALQYMKKIWQSANSNGGYYDIDMRWIHEWMYLSQLSFKELDFLKKMAYPISGVCTLVHMGSGQVGVVVSEHPNILYVWDTENNTKTRAITEHADVLKWMNGLAVHGKFITLEDLA